jgi:2-dehydropantoate 2-reductase
MATARYIIYGAGGVGASLGAQLHQAGRPVVLIARGAHLRAIQAKGLEYRTPQGAARLALPAVGHPNELEFESGDIVVLAMKTQDSFVALDQLQRSGIEDLVILCAQNGVTNERLAMRRFERVYGLAVWIPASFTEAGVVSNYASAAPIDLGRAPEGLDECGREIVRDLRDAGFDAVARENVMDWKYTKLLTNIQTTIDAICGGREGLEDVCQKLREEAEACYEAAGVSLVPHAEHVERLRTAALAMGKIDGVARGRGSSSQSLSRGIGSIETNYINGEIVLLGRLHGVATPANKVVQSLANQLASAGDSATPIRAEALRRLIDERSVAL